MQLKWNSLQNRSTLALLFDRQRLISNDNIIERVFFSSSLLNPLDIIWRWLTRGQWNPVIETFNVKRSNTLESPESEMILIALIRLIHHLKKPTISRSINEHGNLWTHAEWKSIWTLMKGLKVKVKIQLSKLSSCLSYLFN